jgi:predicted amidohydrolase YtcJ
MGMCRNRALQYTAATGAIFMLLAGCGGGGGRDDDVAPADAVYTNGKVLTVDAKFSVAQAFAVKDGKFVAVGATSDVQRYVGSGTQVVDLRGRTVIPGLSDGHFHDAGGGPGIDLSKTRTLAELFAKVSEAAAKAKPGDVLVSNSDWHEAQLAEQRTPRAAELEAAAPGIPVVLVRGGHSYFLNNTALAKWNFTTSTPVPAGGAIPRDPDGKLTGELVDTARAPVQLPPTPAVTLADLEAQAKLLNSYGLTNIRIPGTSIASYRLHQQLRDSGKSTLRYSILFRGVPAATLNSAGIKQGEGDEWIKVWGIKMGVDGGFEGGLMTKAYLDPLGQGGTYFGLRTMAQTAFNDQVIAWNRAGWRVATHAVGDAAMDQVLQGYEMANADKDFRQAGWTIEHAFVSRPDQYPRMKYLNLRLSVQDHLYLAAPVLKNYWGLDRASQVTPVKTYLDQGFLLAGGTDSSVVPFNPFWVLYHFITRDTISAGVYGANQGIGREDALRLLTINYAQLTDEANLKGSIEANKLADFVVLSGDYLAMPVAQIEDLRALATFVGGKRVHVAADANL